MSFDYNEFLKWQQGYAATMPNLQSNLDAMYAGSPAPPPPAPAPAPAPAPPATDTSLPSSLIGFFGSGPYAEILERPFKTIEHLKQQLKDQYETINKTSGYSYRYPDRLDSLFNVQAQMLQNAGITDIYDIDVKTIQKDDQETAKTLINKKTGEPLQIGEGLYGVSFEYKKELGNYGGLDIWGGTDLGKGRDIFGIQFSADGAPVFVPVWQETSDMKKIGQILSIAGMFFAPQLGALLAPSAGAVTQGVIGGALTGGTTAAISGENVLKGAVLGGASGALSGYLAGADTPSLGDGGGGAAELASVGETGYGLTQPIVAPAPVVGGTPGVSQVFPVSSVAPPIETIIPPSALPSADLLGNVTFPKQGIKVPPIDSAQVALIPEGTILPGEGLLAPTLPAISAMGGAQGLSVGVPGGTITQAGLTPVGAVPVLGDPASFINNPDVLGQPVITPEPPTISIQDALRAANIANQLLNPPKQPGMPMQMDQGGGMRAQGVDYSGLLGLLQARAGTPRVSGLLSPAQIRYPSLLG
jgi:hypothetical protein